MASGVGVVLSKRVETVLFEGIPINNWLCLVRLRGSCRLNNRYPDERNQFVDPAYVQRSVAEIQSRWGEIAILARDMKTRVSRHVLE